MLGDIIRGYKKGYWKVIKITPRFCTKNMQKYSHYTNVPLGAEVNCLITVIRYCNDKFIVYKRSKAQDNWDVGWCEKVTPQLLIDEKQASGDLFDKGISLLDEYYS